MIINAVAVQFIISHNIKSNFDQIILLLNETNVDDFILFPECSLSGYSEKDPDFFNKISYNEIDKYLVMIKEIVIKKKIYVLFGSCIKIANEIYNAGILYSYCNNDIIYKKINLAMGERNFVYPGNELNIYNIIYKGEKISIAIQMCREIRFPEQWKYLAIKGASVFFYLTYTTGNQFDVWKSHLISRASENQRYIVSANLASENQQCPTIIISPKGEIICETNHANAEIIRAQLDLSLISDWYINQSRSDLVSIKYKET